MSSASRSAALAAAFAGLLGCGGEEHHEPLRVNARSGATVALSGTTWEACRDEAGSPGVSVLWREEHGDGGGVVYTVVRHDGTGCVGEVLSGVTIGSRASAQGARSVGFIGTPPAGVGSSVVATKVYVDLGAAGTSRDCYWLDDTASPRVLYTGDPSATTDAEGYPNTFLEGGEVERPRAP